MRISFPSADHNLLLQLTFKAMNDTICHKGLVPYSLVLGEYTKLYISSEIPRLRPTTEKRAVMFKQARAEMQNHMEKSCVSRALIQAVPTAAE